MSTLTGVAARNAIRPTALPASARRWPWLKIAVSCWFGVAVLGQLIFAAYVVALYGGAVAAGQMAQWNRVTLRGWVPGDTAGNVVFGTHVLFTVLVLLGGLIQLLPPLRRRAPTLHRWNGRVYLLLALLLSVGGMVMLLTRGTVGGLWQQVGTAVNGLVIAICAAMAWRHARARRFDLHRRWALRLFPNVSGVWFFRIGLMAWLLIFRAPVGFDPKTFSGPFLTALAFGQFLVPLAVLELVFRAQSSPSPALRHMTAALLMVLTGLTALGIVAATLGMWLPRL
jgi:Predicted membrane protein (DUF2306)